MRIGERFFGMENDGFTGVEEFDFMMTTSDSVAVRVTTNEGSINITVTGNGHHGVVELSW